MESTTARVARIAPELPVRNLRSALDYYTDRLGFEIAMDLPNAEYAIVERDGVAIHLFEDKSGLNSPVGVHIFTPDLDDLYRELSGRGADLMQPIESKPWGNREFRVNDGSGNLLKFTEPAG